MPVKLAVQRNSAERAGGEGRYLQKSRPNPTLRLSYRAKKRWVKVISGCSRSSCMVFGHHQQQE
jgi:hypothetical protein